MAEPQSSHQAFVCGKHGLSIPKTKVVHRSSTALALWLTRPNPWRRACRGRVGFGQWGARAGRPSEDQSGAARDKTWARVYSPSDSWNLSISEQSCSWVGWADLFKMR